MATLTPYLTVRDATVAIEFYRRAFGAVELMRMPSLDGQKVMHAHLKIGDSDLMLADEFPEMGGTRAPTTLGATSVTIHMSSPNVDQTMATAAAAGAKVLMPPADMFWGDRFGILRDPFGHEWSIATTIRKMTPDQMRAAMPAVMSQQQQQQ